MKNAVLTLCLILTSSLSFSKNIDNEFINVSLSSQSSELTHRTNHSTHIKNLNSLPSIENIELIPDNLNIKLPSADELKVGFELEINQEKKEIYLSYSFVENYGAILINDPNNLISREEFSEPIINLFVVLETPATASIVVNIPKIQKIYHTIKYESASTNCIKGLLPTHVNHSDILYNICLE